MNGSHVPFDHLLVAACVALALVEWLWYWPSCLRRLAAGVPGVRLGLYRNIMLAEWGLVAGVVALWLADGRAWEALQLGWGEPGWRTGAGFGAVALYLAFAWVQRRALLDRPEILEKVFQRHAYSLPLLPRTAPERKVFLVLGITAGVCEEVFFRGFVLWYFALWTGPALAVVLSSALFSFGHLYLGVRHVARTAAVGLVLALLVLASGSLWPAILLHVVQDLVAGDLGYHAHRIFGSKGRGGGPAAEPVPGIV